MESGELIQFLSRSAIGLYLIWNYGFIYGIISIVILIYLYDLVMRFFFGLVPLGAMDEIFLYEHK